MHSGDSPVPNRPKQNLSRLLWAKSDRGAEKGRWKPVLAHLLDVAACAWELLDLEPEATLNQYARDFGYGTTPEGRGAARRWVCALIALHDLGKASPAFEQQWTEWPVKAQAAALGLEWPEDATGPRRRPVVSHSVISQVTLPELLIARGWDDLVAEGLADAVGAHHGFRASQQDQTHADFPKERGDGPWAAARGELVDAVCFALDVPDAPGITALDGGAYMRLAGLTSFADWIGSSFDLARFAFGDIENPRHYLEVARGQAREKLATIGWEKRTPLLARPQTFAEVFGYLARDGRPFGPRPLQQAAEDLLRDVSAPTLLVVEAPMGEGKSEVALYAHVTLQLRLGHRGLYIALPTQATGNAMFRRTLDFLDQVGGGKALDLQLLHGGKDLNQDFRALRVQPNTDEAQEKQEAERAIRAREWFTVRKRALLSEYGVGTVDQALLGVLPVAHQFIRLWGLGNRTVVLDEVHAYDVYTGSLIEELVKWLRALGSSVILMSATLPRERRAALLRAYGAQEVPWADYPRLTRVADGVAEARHVQADPKRDREITLHGLPEGVDAIAARVLELHARGGVTAAIVNTVQRAQDLYRTLRQAGVPEGDLLLFHARYRNGDRRTREEQVLARLGKDGGRPRRMILLGSQVLEQSLDYDADVMVTDLAPLDLVLQRAGRLHRHDRDPSVRAGHAHPALHVAGLTAGRRPDLKTTAWGRVYQPWTLLRAWAVLGERGAIALPRDLDALVQAAYAEEDPEGLGQEDRLALAEARTRKTSQDDVGATTAALAAIASPGRFTGSGVQPEVWDDDPRADDDPVPAQTRLGDESVTVIPLFHSGGVLALQPGGPGAPLRRKDFEVGADERDRRVAALHECAVRLGRWEVVRGIAQHARAHGLGKLHWPELAALRDAHPLVLDEQDGRWQAEVGGLTVEYDLELGVVYR